VPDNADRQGRFPPLDGRDFVTVSEVIETTKDGRVYRSSRIDYHATLSMGKELSMVENNHQGHMIRSGASGQRSAVRQLPLTFDPWGDVPTCLH
jgi:AntA/AntB antirepressor